MDKVNDVLKPSDATPVVAPPPAIPFNIRVVIGLIGILFASMMAGLNGRIPGLVLIDIQGGLGFSKDDISWITTAYSAGELAAMPFAGWFAITFSIRRFHIAMVISTMLVTAILPLIHNLELLIGLRFIQGMVSGSLIPILMISLLRFIPLPMRLYGLAIFALIATFTPNIALWLAELCVDRLNDWRWVYWHVLILGSFAIPMVAWGIPNMPMFLDRLKQANWFSALLGIPALVLLVIGIDQGVRLDWFNSNLIIVSLSLGTILFILFIISEEISDSHFPFVKLGILKRRNIGLGLFLFFIIFMLFTPGVTLPATILSNLHGFRMEQSSTIGLMVGLPQLILGPCVAFLLYQRWVDPRYVFSIGLIFMAIGCFLVTKLTSTWMIEQFFWAEILQIIGQPLVVVPLLFLITTVVNPTEGPAIAGLINILRVFSATIVSASVGQISAVRGRFHSEMLLDTSGRYILQTAQNGIDTSTLGQLITQQVSIKAYSDVYMFFSILTLLLIPIVLNLHRVFPPKLDK